MTKERDTLKEYCGVRSMAGNAIVMFVVTALLEKSDCHKGKTGRMR